MTIFYKEYSKDYFFAKNSSIPTNYSHSIFVNVCETQCILVKRVPRLSGGGNKINVIIFTSDVNIKLGIHIYLKTVKM